MKKWRDLGTGILVSILVHTTGLLVLSAHATLLTRPRAELQSGESGMLLTLLPSHLMVPTEQNDADLAVVLTQPDSDVAENAEPEKAETESRSVPEDADMLDKGVQQVPKRRAAVRIRYPLGAKEREEEGTVILRVKVDSRGRVRVIEILQSSGYSSLDRQAKKQLKKARYSPGLDSDGNPQAGEVTETVTFKLQDR